ncbi:MAG TPA: hypothetical protein VMC79_09795 [Rectinemataceae bacterium]|nr:hypothetical protein [Rectinemataceae bacterium]
MTGSAWVRAQDRRRSLIAVGATVALYVLGFLVVVIVGLLVPSHEANAQGPLVVDLGLPEGSVSSLPLGVPNAPERPIGLAPTPPAQAQPSTQPAAQPSAAASSAPPAATSSSRPGTASVGAPPAPGGTAPRSPSTVATGAPPTASQSPAATTRSFSSSPGSSVQGSTPGLVVGTGTVTFRGSEMGNLLDTTFVAASGKIGRNLYVPIWLYMPLPHQVSDAIYQAIPADAGGYYTASARKDAFRQYYSQSGGVWTQKPSVPYDARAFIWLMLQDAGVDPSRAEFKQQQNLKPVAIDFVVGPGPKPALVYVDLVSSSGSKEIDDAVLYGFRQATFFNNTGTSVSGHFTYDFNAAPTK